MKTFFIQLWQLMLKYKKRLIYTAFAFFIGLFCFSGLGWIWLENEVFAVDSNNTSNNDVFQEKATEWYERLSFIHKTLHVLVYPLILVAGKLADNSFVYWEVFWFDAVLWKLWNIVRNFSNFALWFLLVYKILEFLVKWVKSWDVKNLLVRWLIAWVWIQASWFVMGALIDVSTILAYGVWWLPIYILKDTSGWTTDEDLKFNPYVLKYVWYRNIEDTDTSHVYFTNVQSWDVKSWDFYISACETFSYKDWGQSEQLILAPKMIYHIEKNCDWEKIRKTDDNRCHFWTEVYYFSSLYQKIKSKFVSCSSEEDCRKKQNEYESALRASKGEIIGSSKWTVQGLIRSATILEIWDAHTSGGVVGFLWPIMYSKNQKYWLDLYNKWTGEWWKTARLHDVLNSNSFVGVFTALYSYLLNSWRTVISEDAGIFPALLNTFLSLAYLLAIGIPLIAVALVFMMRVWVLRMAIALLPFIVLFKAFDLEKKLFKDKPLEYLKVENLIPIIFAPAIICFAISMSTVLIVVIYSLNIESIEPVKNEILWWLIKLDVGGLSIGLWKLIISAFWVAVTWFMLWAAIEATELWRSSIISWLKGLATSALWSIPLVPIPWNNWNWVEFIWANAAFGLDGNGGIISKLTNKIKGELESSDQKAVEQWLDPKKAAKEADNQKATTYANKLVTLSVSELGNDWRTKAITIGEWSNQQSITFNSLGDAGKEEVINKINNISDSNTRAAFGKVWDIEIWEWNDKKVYKFDGSDNKYKV